MAGNQHADLEGAMHPGTLILDIHASYKLAPHMVVFSHGFGVDRTDKGLFTDIVEDLPEGYGYVLFDYYEFAEDGSTSIPTLTDHQRILLNIIAWLSKQSGVADISLVAHSLGCIVAALAQAPELDKVVMMAPPLNLGAMARDNFAARVGAVQEGNVWHMKRHDGASIYVASDFINELDAVDPEQALLDYCSVQPYALLIAGADDVLPGTDYNDLALAPDITASTIDNASHNFTGTAREEVKAAIYDWLTQ